jgi:hypothetical protein
MRFWKGWRRVVKIRITIDGAAFEFEGDAAFASDVKPLLEQWFTVLLKNDQLTQAQIDKLADRIRLANAALDTAARAARS